MGAEEEVREAWIDNFSTGEAKTGHWRVIAVDTPWGWIRLGEGPSEKAAWTAAADYTRLHRQKIAWVEEEISLIMEQISNFELLRCGMDQKNRDLVGKTIAVENRILEARQDALADLRRGWKGKP